MSWMPCPHCDERVEVFGSGGGQSVADALTRVTGTTVPLLGQIPIDLRLREGGDGGVPIVLSDPSAPASTVLTEVAEKLTVRSRGLVGMSLSVSRA
jgi:ATP-binding protein involved in chromosome partitioning